MAKDIVSGVGTRHGVILLLDTTTGIPLPGAASAVPYVGVEIEGIMTATANDPAPRNITHNGEDRPYAQDSLPPDSLESFAVTSSKTNLILDTVLEGTKIRSYTGAEARIANNDRKGREPLVMAMFYRQALDTDKNSATFGKLRQWNARIYPSTRLVPSTDEYGKDKTDKTYNGTPSNAGYTPWNEDINITNWGAKEGSHLEMTFDKEPIPHVYLGNGTLTGFSLTVPVTAVGDILAWADGTIATVSGVNTSTTNPAFTLSSAVPNLKQLFAFALTNTP